MEDFTVKEIIEKYDVVSSFEYFFKHFLRPSPTFFLHSFIFLRRFDYLTIFSTFEIPSAVTRNVGANNVINLHQDRFWIFNFGCKVCRIFPVYRFVDSLWECEWLHPGPIEAWLLGTERPTPGRNFNAHSVRAKAHFEEKEFSGAELND